MFLFNNLGSKIGSTCRNGGGGGTTPEPGPTDPPPEGYQRTVVFLYKETSPGQYVFFKGGKVNGNKHFLYQ